MPRRNNYQPSIYLSFDGATSCHVDTGAVNVVPNAASALSGSVWVYLNGYGAGTGDNIRVIAGNRQDSVTKGWVWKVSQRALDKIEFTFFDQNSSSQGWISNVTVPYYRWVHIGFTFDGTQVIFYIDGNPDAKETVGVAKTITMNDGQNVRIGHRQAAGSGFEHFTGHMSGLALWNRKLTAAEFIDIYNNRRLPSTGLIAHWPMTEGSGTQVAASTGGFNGTITGGVTWSTTNLNGSRSAASTRGSATRSATSARAAVS